MIEVINMIESRMSELEKMRDQERESGMDTAEYYRGALNELFRLSEKLKNRPDKTKKVS